MPVEFGDLPKGPPPGGAWAEEVAELRAHPHQWARLATKNTTGTAGETARQMRQGKLKNFRPVGHFQVVTRGSDVWARYVGDGATS